MKNRTPLPCWQVWYHSGGCFVKKAAAERTNENKGKTIGAGKRRRRENGETDEKRKQRENNPGA